jgi:hypothetical protein
MNKESVMNNNWKKSIEERVEQFRAFYAKETKRPLPGFYFGSEYPVHRFILRIANNNSEVSFFYSLRLVFL